MDDQIISHAIECSQCGGELHPDEGQIFLTCPYCYSTVYLDKSQVVFHWYLAPTLDEEKTHTALARWMAGNQTVKDLDKKSRVVAVSFEYFPIWYFKHRRPDGKEEISLEPAAGTSVSEIKSINLPAGDLRKYEHDLEQQSRAPTVPLQVALNWLQGGDIQQDEIVEQALVHVPLYTFKYTYRNESYTALVEAGTGGVFANIFPAKAEAPYFVAGGLTALVYLCLALFPIFGALFSSWEGLAVSVLVCTGLGILAGPVLFALAVWVAAKV